MIVLLVGMAYGGKLGVATVSLYPDGGGRVYQYLLALLRRELAGRT